MSSPQVSGLVAQVQDGELVVRWAGSSFGWFGGWRVSCYVGGEVSGLFSQVQGGELVVRWTGRSADCFVW